jgi:signal transduction histidine kinase/CheY-like chemotaxis protein
MPGLTTFSDTSSDSGVRDARGNRLTGPTESSNSTDGTASSVLSGLDARLRLPGDSRDDRLRKSAVFLLASFLSGVLALFVLAGAATGIFRAFEYVLLGTLATFSAVSAIVLWRTRKVRWALCYAHSVVIALGVLFTLSVPWSAGIGIIDENGEPKRYHFTVILIVPAITAFTLRSRKFILLYSCLSAAIALVLSIINPRNDDTRGMSGMLVTTILAQLITGFTFAFFQSVSDGLSEENMMAKGKMKTAVREAKAERRANEAKSRFVSVMSHEIRNPLQAVLLQLEMLETTTLSLQQLDYVKGIGRASQVLLAIVNDVLDVTKIESGVIALESAEFNVREACEFTLQTVAPAAARKDIALFLSFPADLSPWVRGDVTRVRQVLHNLLGNALKFTMDGEVEVAVSRGSTVQPSTVGTAYEWTFSVRDTGIGINSEGQQKLFREFSQVDESTTRQFGGTGLGLYISKQLANRMDGDIGVESQVDSGSTFWFTVTLDSVPTPVPRPLPDLGIAKGLQVTAIVASEDDAVRMVLRRYLQHYLSVARFLTVTEHSSPFPVLKELRAKPFSGSSSSSNLLLCLYDESILIEEVSRQAAKMPNVMFVSLVPPGLARDRRAMLEAAGWTKFLQKPVTLVNLGEELHGWTEEAQSGRPRSSKGGGSGTSRGLVMDGSADHDGGGGGGTLRGNGEDAKTVLIVDDFETMRNLVSMIVTQQGYNVVTAQNGQEAVDLFESRSFDLCLCDVEMPEKDGHQVAQEIRQLEQMRGTTTPLPIVAMTANAMSSDRDKALASGMTDFASKPLRREAVIALLDKYCGSPHGPTPSYTAATPSTAAAAAPPPADPVLLGGGQSTRKHNKSKRNKKSAA